MIDYSSKFWEECLLGKTTNFLGVHSLNQHCPQVWIYKHQSNGSFSTQKKKSNGS